jgi:hypothetical protein
MILPAGSSLGYSYTHIISLSFIVILLVILAAFGFVKLADWLYDRNRIIPKQLRSFDM